jgi:hypothetical protein
MKLTMLEIQDMFVALQKLGERDLPIAYELAKNMRILKKEIAAYEEDRNTVHEKFADKDAGGAFIEYIEKDMYGRDERVRKISDPAKLMEFNREHEKMLKDVRDVIVHRVLLKRVTNGRDGRERDLPAMLLAPLLETIFVETEEELKVPQKETEG